MTQYSPCSCGLPSEPWSPLGAPHRRSTLVPSSAFGRHCLVVSSRTSSPPLPFSEKVALSVAKHRSPTARVPLLPVCCGFEEQEAYRRSIEPPGDSSKPSPAQEVWLLVPDVRPSTLPEEYPKLMVGIGPPVPGGARNGYCQLKSPEEPPTDQDTDGDNEVLP